MAFQLVLKWGEIRTVILASDQQAPGRAILFRVRWLFRLLLVQWICLTLPSVNLVEYWDFPLSLFLDQLLICVSSFLVAGLVRLLSRRRLQNYCCGVPKDGGNRDRELRIDWHRWRVVDHAALESIALSPEGNRRDENCGQRSQNAQGDQSCAKAFVVV